MREDSKLWSPQGRIGTADEPDDNQSLANIKLTLKRVKEDYKEVARILKRYYGDTDL